MTDDIKYFPCDFVKDLVDDLRSFDAVTDRESFIRSRISVANGGYEDDLTPVGSKVYVFVLDLADGKLLLKDGTKSSLYGSKVQNEIQKTANCVGLVFLKGPDCYKGLSKFTYDWCNVGDLITFPRNSAIKIGYLGAEVMILDDDSILGVLKRAGIVCRI